MLGALCWHFGRHFHLSPRAGLTKSPFIPWWDKTFIKPHKKPIEKNRKALHCAHAHLQHPPHPFPKRTNPLGTLGDFSLCPCAWLSERQRELAKAALRRQGLLGAPTAPKPTPKRSDPLFLFSKCVFPFSRGDWETQRIKNKSLGPYSAGSV